MGACDFIRVKHYSPRTEQANFDGIKRFIDFHGKRHPPEVRPTYGIWAEYLIDRPGSTSTLQRPLRGAVHYGCNWPVVDPRTYPCCRPKQK